MTADSSSLTKIFHVHMRVHTCRAKCPFFLSVLLCWNWRGLLTPQSTVWVVSSNNGPQRPFRGDWAGKPHLHSCWMGRRILPCSQKWWASGLQNFPENCLYWLKFSCNIVCFYRGGEMGIARVSCILNEHCTSIWFKKKIRGQQILCTA